MARSKQSPTSSSKNLVNFFFELGLMKKFKHTGVKFAGIKDPDTLGEHSCRSAQIGYMMACMVTKANPEHVALLCTIHDVGEIRIGDAHRIASRYLETKKAERQAIYEQTEMLPEVIKTRIRAAWDEFHDQKTLDSHIARDADLIETMLQAKEYLDCGHIAARRWLMNGSSLLKTKLAKDLYKQLNTTQFTDWWDTLN